MMMKSLLRTPSIGKMAQECFDFALELAELVTNEPKLLVYQAEESIVGLKDTFTYANINITIKEMVTAGFGKRKSWLRRKWCQCTEERIQVGCEEDRLTGSELTGFLHRMSRREGEIYT